MASREDNEVEPQDDDDDDDFAEQPGDEAAALLSGVPCERATESRQLRIGGLQLPSSRRRACIATSLVLTGSLVVKLVGSLDRRGIFSLAPETQRMASLLSESLLESPSDSEDDISSQSCERCPTGSCDREGGEVCYWYEGDNAYHCEVRGCDEVPLGSEYSGCWFFEGKPYYSIWGKRAACQADKPVFSLEEFNCERCPIGVCDRLSGEHCYWFQGDLSFHCEVTHCSMVPSGDMYSACWYFGGKNYYSLRYHDAPCKEAYAPRAGPEELPVSEPSPQPSPAPEPAPVPKPSPAPQVNIPLSVEPAYHGATTTTTTADGALAPSFPEIDLIWLPESETDQERVPEFYKEIEKWVPGGRRKVREHVGVHPELWPEGGTYDQVDRWCSMLPRNPEFAAEGDHWWRSTNWQVPYAAITKEGTPDTDPGLWHHVGCTLSHFTLWMNARDRGVHPVLVAESDGTPMHFGTYAGFVEDFQHVVIDLAKGESVTWDLVFLDKCRTGTEGGPVWDLDLPRGAHSGYKTYKFTGKGMAGAALYMVSRTFLEQVPQMIYNNSLFMVDAYIDWRCQEDLRCFSVCATSPPFNSDLYR